MNLASAGTEIDPRYSIGIPEMDVQHARWIDLIAKFRSVGSTQLLEQAGIDAARRTLEELLNYTMAHFASEEQLLARHNYPELDAHKLSHREIEAMVTRLLGEARAARSGGTPLKLNLFVTVWLLEHIMQEDGKYARYILDKIPSEADRAHR